MGCAQGKVTTGQNMRDGVTMRGVFIFVLAYLQPFW
jgi:hypothetical protein